MRAWTPPRFEEICMNAEIGAYQTDFSDALAPEKSAVFPREEAPPEADSAPRSPVPEIAA